MAMTLVLWHLVSAASPPENDSDPGNGRWVGLISTAVECLVVKAGTPDTASATVYLEWEGQIEEAFLVLAPAGSRGGHSIYINGRRVGTAPVWPGGQLCQIEAPIVDVPIPAEVLTQGENVITLTNDRDITDGWAAANVHLEIHGILSGPPAASLEPIRLASPILGLRTAAVMSGTIPLTSSYELAQGRVVTQLVSYQVPASYTGNISVPLLIGVHGMGSTGEWMRDFLAAEANNRGWLLAAPDMHGRYYINTGEYALAYLGAQHDIIDTIEYVMSEYQVDPSRLYLLGHSMGGEIATVVAAKYPDVFAAAAEWSGFTDLADWYYELGTLEGLYGTLTRIRRETGGTPSDVPFEYQRRSAMEMPQNSRLIPLHMWHNEADLLVPIHHSLDLADAINSWSPPMPVTVTTATVVCTDTYQHCYSPNLAEVFDYLGGFALSAHSPSSLTIRTDESKPYYWLNVAQTGGDHWSQVQASYDRTKSAVTAHISDTRPLALAFNLGSTPSMGRVTERPGMGLPATTYLVKGGGNYRLADYTAGYLSTTLTVTGQFSLTISAIAAQVSADPFMVLAGQAVTSTVQAVLLDQLDNPVPDGTTVEFSTTEGIFANGSSTYVTTSMGGEAIAILSLESTADLAEITASVESVTGSTSVDMIHPVIDLLVTSDQATIYSGQAVTYIYQITNTGDITLTGVTVVDDNGTPGDSGDDLTVCANVTLAVEASRGYSRSGRLSHSATITAIATGQDPLGYDVTDSGSTTVTVEPSRRIYLPLISKFLRL